MNELTNLGFSTIRDKAVGKTSTIIIVGVARSGTSMVAAMLREMGVFLGETADDAVHEDTEIAAAIEGAEPEKLAALISTRNYKHDRWAFKRPEAFLHLRPLLPLFRNPRIIATFRDAAAIAQRNAISVHLEYLTGLKHAGGRTMQLIQFLEDIESPVFTASYEKAMAKREAFLDALCHFCGIRPTERQLKRALNVMINGPEHYLQATRIPA